MSPRTRLWVLACGVAGVAALLAVTVWRLPPFGGPRHPYGERAVEAALASRVANAVASVNFDQRAFDTLGEQAILFGSVLGTVVVLRQTRDERRVEPEPAGVAGPVRRYALIALPVVLLTGVYVVAHGQLSPGGGFQGGVVAATGLHLLYVAVDYRALKRVRSVHLFTLADAAGEAGYLLLGTGGLLAGTAYLTDVLPLGTFGTLASGGTVPLLNAAIGVEVAAAVVVLLARFLDQAIEIVTSGEEGDRAPGTDGAPGTGGARPAGGTSGADSADGADGPHRTGRGGAG